MLPLILGIAAVSAATAITKKVVERKIDDSNHQAKTIFERFLTEKINQFFRKKLINWTLTTVVILVAYFVGLYFGNLQFIVAFAIFSAIFPPACINIIQALIISFISIRMMVAAGSIFPQKVFKHYASIHVHRHTQNLSAPSRLLNRFIGISIDEIESSYVNVLEGLYLKAFLRFTLWSIGCFLYNSALNFVINQNIGLISFIDSIFWPITILFL